MISIPETVYRTERVNSTASTFPSTESTNVTMSGSSMLDLIQNIDKTRRIVSVASASRDEQCEHKPLRDESSDTFVIKKPSQQKQSKKNVILGSLTVAPNCKLESDNSKPKPLQQTNAVQATTSLISLNSKTKTLRADNLNTSNLQPNNLQPNNLQPNSLKTNNSESSYLQNDLLGNKLQKNRPQLLVSDCINAGSSSSNENREKLHQTSFVQPRNCHGTPVKITLAEPRLKIAPDRSEIINMDDTERCSSKNNAQPCSPGAIKNSSSNSATVLSNVVSYLSKNFDSSVKSEAWESFSESLNQETEKVSQLKKQLCQEQALNSQDTNFLSQNTKINGLLKVLDKKNDAIEKTTAELQSQETQRDLILQDIITKLDQEKDAANDIETMKRLLERREHQLRQAEIVATTRQKQYQELLKELAVKENLLSQLRKAHPEETFSLTATECKTASQLDYLENEVTSMRAYVDELKFENQELEHLINQRNEQFKTLINSLRTEKDNNSAVTLINQALSMVGNPASLEKNLKLVKTELEAKKSELKDLQSKYDETHKDLKLQRVEATNLIETLRAKDLQINKLEATVQSSENELINLCEEKKQLLYEKKKRVRQLQFELDLMEDTQVALKEELAFKDKQSIELTSEIIRQSRYSQTAADRIRLLSTELKEAQEHIEKLIKHNQEKDKYLEELEEFLKEHDAKQHKTYLAEVFKNQKLLSDFQFKEREEFESQQIQDAELMDLQANLKKSSKQLLDVHLLTQTSKKQSSRSTGRPLTDRYALNASSRLETSEYSHYPQKNKSLKHANSPKSLSNLKDISSSRTTTDQYEISSEEAAKTTSTGYSSHLSSKKKTKHRDEVHLALRSQLKLGQWKHLKGLFFKLGNGKYLFGSQRVRLRLHQDTGELEGSLNFQSNHWEPFEYFVSAALAKFNEKVLPTKHISDSITAD